MNEPSEPVAALELPVTINILAAEIAAVKASVKRLERRVGAYEAFLDTLASDARFFANAQKKALLEGGSAMINDG